MDAFFTKSIWGWILWDVNLFTEIRLFWVTWARAATPLERLREPAGIGQLVTSAQLQFMRLVDLPVAALSSPVPPEKARVTRSWMSTAIGFKISVVYPRTRFYCGTLNVQDWRSVGPAEALHANGLFAHLHKHEACVCRCDIYMQWAVKWAGLRVTWNARVELI